MLFSLIVLVVFFNFPPYPSPFRRITFNAKWNDVRWALYGPFSYEKIGFAISTVGTFEAWRSISWYYAYWNSRRVFCHIPPATSILQANTKEEDLIMMGFRIIRLLLTENKTIVWLYLKKDYQYRLFLSTSSIFNHNVITQYKKDYFFKEISPCAKIHGDWRDAHSLKVVDVIIRWRSSRKLSSNRQILASPQIKFQFCLFIINHVVVVLGSKKMYLFIY